MLVIAYIFIYCICLLMQEVNTMDEMFVLLYAEEDNDNSVQDFEGEEVQDY